MHKTTDESKSVKATEQVSANLSMRLNTSHVAATWADTLRAAISASPHSRYEIAKAAGIQQSALSRLMAGKSVSLGTAEAIGRAVGLTLTKQE